MHGLADVDAAQHVVRARTEVEAASTSGEGAVARSGARHAAARVRRRWTAAAGEHGIPGTALGEFLTRQLLLPALLGRALALGLGALLLGHLLARHLLLPALFGELLGPLLLRHLLPCQFLLAALLGQLLDALLFRQLLTRQFCLAPPVGRLLAFRQRTQLLVQLLLGHTFAFRPGTLLLGRALSLHLPRQVFLPALFRQLPRTFLFSLLHALLLGQPLPYRFFLAALLGLALRVQAGLLVGLLASQQFLALLFVLRRVLRRLARQALGFALVLVGRRYRFRNSRQRWRIGLLLLRVRRLRRRFDGRQGHIEFGVDVRRALNHVRMQAIAAAL
jgi:hypothetical protein